MYVEAARGLEKKAEVSEIVSELKSAFGDIIRNSWWMDDETKVDTIDRFVETSQFQSALHFKARG